LSVANKGIILIVLGTNFSRTNKGCLNFSAHLNNINCLYIKLFQIS